MFRDQILPRIRPSAPNDTFVVRLRTFGLPESTAAQLLEGFEQEFEDISLGYRVHFPEVDVKVLARGRSQTSASSPRRRIPASASRASTQLAISVTHSESRQGTARSPGVRFTPDRCWSVVASGTPPVRVRRDSAREPR
jgi:molybdopterin-biosynthesis enzyme MoeA-like protein